MQGAEQTDTATPDEAFLRLGCPLLRKYFAREERQLKALVERLESLVSDPDTGGLVEVFVRSFLEKHLPTIRGVTRGVLFDLSGDKTDERDVIITDLRAPRFPLDKDGFHLVPIESALATFEIKKTGSESALAEAHQQLAKVKGLRILPDEGTGFRHRAYDRRHPTCIVFFASAPSNFIREVATWLSINDPRHVIDMVAVVGQGFVLSSLLPFFEPPIDHTKYHTCLVLGKGYSLAGLSQAVNRPPRCDFLPSSYFNFMLHGDACALEHDEIFILAKKTRDSLRNFGRSPEARRATLDYLAVLLEDLERRFPNSADSDIVKMRNILTRSRPVQPAIDDVPPASAPGPGC